MASPFKRRSSQTAKRATGSRWTGSCAKLRAPRLATLSRQDRTRGRGTGTRSAGRLGKGLGGRRRESAQPIDLAALQATLDATAKELLVPGALVMLSTPRSRAAYRTSGLTTLPGTLWERPLLLGELNDGVTSSCTMALPFHPLSDYRSDGRCFWRHAPGCHLRAS
jgi:hypothetical protein